MRPLGWGGIIVERLTFSTVFKFLFELMLVMQDTVYLVGSSVELFVECMQLPFKYLNDFVFASK